MLKRDLHGAEANREKDHDGFSLIPANMLPREASRVVPFRFLTSSPPNKCRMLFCKSIDSWGIWGAASRRGHELPDAIPNELLPFLRQIVCTESLPDTYIRVCSFSCFSDVSRAVLCRLLFLLMLLEILLSRCRTCLPCSWLEQTLTSRLRDTEQEMQRPGRLHRIQHLKVTVITVIHYIHYIPLPSAG